MDQDLGDVLLTYEQIQEAVAWLGQQITADYRGLDLHVVGVLRGAAPFTTDLVLHIDLPLTLDFIGITSYASTDQPTGIVRITKDLDENVDGRHVLVMEGIVDTGLTLSYILKNLGLRRPASVKVCTLLDKPARRLIDVPIAYRGFTIPDEFVVGYGLDWQQKYRNLPYIATLRPEALRSR
jgi:hypoxanthine phosphoribosyltransferase